jgi:hypothetical protein
MPNPENIIPPKKGEIRNPKGKPVGTLNRSTILKRWISANSKIKNPETNKEEFGTVEDAIALALIKRGLSGDVQAIKEIYDTLYGKITEKSNIEHSGKSFKIVINGDSDTPEND